VLRLEYGVTNDLTNRSEEDLRRLAFHEAGHLVVAETLQPGCTGLATINPKRGDEVNGFIHLHHRMENEADQVTLALAGKTAVEMYYACDKGFERDILRAASMLRDMICSGAVCGLAYTDSTTETSREISEALNSRIDTAVGENLEKHAMRARAILIEKRELLKKTVETLIEKKTLLYSDIRKLTAGN
ncbi:MAG: hypothetical protein CW338_12055, partial [Clostridiales bacterium]|nr:hypothetical protein [Clostridiales bacterium]